MGKKAAIIPREAIEEKYAGIFPSKIWIGVYLGMTDEIIDYMAKVVIDAIDEG